MGKKLNDFKEKICKKGKPCGNSCVSAIKNCLKSKKPGNPSQTSKTGNNPAKKKNPAASQSTKTPESYKADPTDHAALIKIGERFSGETMGKAVKSLDEAISQKDAAFKNARITKKGEIYKQDMKRLGELDKKAKLAEEALESAAKETMRKIAAHHKIDREDAQMWASSVDTRGLKGENKEITLDSLTAVYALTGGRGSAGVKKITNETDRASANPQTGEIKLREKVDRKQVFHEYAHFMEYENPQLAVASRNFIESRSTSPRPMKLKDIDNSVSYRDDEMAFPGRFIDPYMGKIYGNADTPTEIISMGVELFRSPREMAMFYKNDPEHFNFVLGAILHEN
jgi:hypothetical protein